VPVLLKVFGSANPVAEASGVQILNTRASGSGVHVIYHLLVAWELAFVKETEVFLVAEEGNALQLEKWNKKPTVMLKMPERLTPSVELPAHPPALEATMGAFTADKWGLDTLDMKLKALVG